MSIFIEKAQYKYKILILLYANYFIGINIYVIESEDARTPLNATCIGNIQRSLASLKLMRKKGLATLLNLLLCKSYVQVGAAKAHGPRPTARRPSPDFPQFFCPAINPRACTDLHRVWACKMDDGEFEVVYHLII